MGAANDPKTEIGHSCSAGFLTRTRMGRDREIARWAFYLNFSENGIRRHEDQEVF